MRFVSFNSFAESKEMTYDSVTLKGVAYNQSHPVDWPYISFKRVVHPRDFENKRFVRNACLLSRLFQTGKVQTKAETIERNVRWEG